MVICLVFGPQPPLVPTGSHRFPEPVNHDWFPTTLPYGVGTSREPHREPVENAPDSHESGTSRNTTR